MKFKPGDLVEVDHGIISFSLVGGRWTQRNEPVFGVVVSVQETELYMREKSGRIFLTYDVLVDGKIERKIESALKLADHQEREV